MSLIEDVLKEKCEKILALEARVADLTARFEQQKSLNKQAIAEVARLTDERDAWHNSNTALLSENARLTKLLDDVKNVWNRYYIVRTEFNADYQAGRYWFSNAELDAKWAEPFAKAFVDLMNELLGLKEPFAAPQPEREFSMTCGKCGSQVHGTGTWHVECACEEPAAAPQPDPPIWRTCRNCKEPHVVTRGYHVVTRGYQNGCYLGDSSDADAPRFCAGFYDGVHVIVPENGLRDPKAAPQKGDEKP